MKVDRFKAQVSNFQRSNYYNVAFFGTGPAVSGLAIRGVKCESATIPGQGFFMTEDSEYGPKRAIPHKPQFDAFDCSFYLDDSFEDRELLELWMGKINGFRQGNFHSKFHDNYTGVILVEALRKYGGGNYRCIMSDAYPVQMGVLNFGYANSELAKFNCQWRFRHWQGEFQNSKQNGLITGFMDKHLNKLETKVRSKIEDELFG